MMSIAPLVLLVLAGAGAGDAEECERLLGGEKYAAAAECFDERATDWSLSQAERAAARELAAAARAARSPTPRAAGEGDVSVSQLIESGAPELVVHSAAFGGAMGFLAAGAGLSLTRINETDSLPWLVGAPAFGIVAGGAAASAATYAFGSTPGDAALISSTMWLGLVEGFALQWIAFDQRTDVGHIPLRFATPLAVAGATTALGAGSALLLDVDAGDVGLANSAALWTPALTYLTLLTIASSGAQLPSFGADPVLFLVGIGMVSSALPWLGTLALHPFLDVERPATWLIEAGALAGGATGFATLIFLSLLRLPQQVQFGILTTGVAAGVIGGTVAAFLLSDLVRQLPPVADVTGVLFAGPTLLPTSKEGELAPGAVVSVEF